MFSIIISEKGGTERRQTFDQAEVTVGRVQGNDLMLPKGNVSKRHCRLERVDDNFVVTDQNSTNGTYVNRRRITQGTVVRQGDRIYIGDFILRIEEGGADGSEEPLQPPPPIGLAQSTGAQSTRGQSTRGQSTKGLPNAAQTQVAASSDAEPGAERSVQQDPVPEGTSSGLASGDGMPAVTASAGDRSLSAAPVRPATPDGPAEASPANTVHQRGAPTEVPAPPRGRRATTDKRMRPPSSDGPQVPAATTERLPHPQLVDAVTTVVSRVLDELPFELVDPVTTEVRGQVGGLIEQAVTALASEISLDAGITPAQVAELASAELLDLGTLTGLMSDSSVEEVAVSGVGHLSVVKNGISEAGHFPFCTSDTLQLALHRLCHLSARPVAESEQVVVRDLSGSAFRLSAIRSGLSPRGVLLRLTRRRRVSTNFDGLVRAGVVSRAMATFLAQCVQGQVNLLVVGGQRSGAEEVLSALCHAIEPERVLLLQHEVEIATESGSVVPVRTTTEQQISETLEAISDFPGHRLVIDGMRGEATSAMLGAVADGATGVVARVMGSSIERACAQVKAQLTGESGMLAPAAAVALMSGLSLAIEVARLRDGRSRVLRIAELELVDSGQLTASNVFEFEVERTATGGTVEGKFRPTGFEPKVAAELRARGSRLDATLFRR